MADLTFHQWGQRRAFGAQNHRLAVVLNSPAHHYALAHLFDKARTELSGDVAAVGSDAPGLRLSIVSLRGPRMDDGPEGDGA